MKIKTIKRLEAIIDALETSKEVCSHNDAEIRFIDSRLFCYQRRYQRLTGKYYVHKS